MVVGRRSFPLVFQPILRGQTESFREGRYYVFHIFAVFWYMSPLVENLSSWKNHPPRWVMNDP